jgi:hypothetical protein
MAVPTVNIRVNYRGDGVTTAFVFGFYVPKPEYMAVIYRDVDGTPRTRTDFTVVLNANQDVAPGGVLTFDTAPVDGELGVIYRFVPYQQQTSYTPYDPFRAKSHEAALDFLEFQIQQLKEIMDRAVVSDPVDPGEQLLLPAYSPGRHWQWSTTVQGAITNGLTLTEQDARWAAKVHGHAQTDVTGLVDDLAARELTVDHDADVASLQGQINVLSTGKADDNAVVKLTGNQSIAGTKTFSSTPQSTVEPASNTGLANKGYVDRVYNSLVGIIVKGVLDLSPGDSALPPAPQNGDTYFVGVAGTVTVSLNGAAPAPLLVPVDSRLIWVQDSNFWLFQAPATGTVIASSVSYDPSGDTIITSTNVQGALGELDTAAADLQTDKLDRVDPIAEGFGLSVEPTGGGWYGRRTVNDGAVGIKLDQPDITLQLLRIDAGNALLSIPLEGSPAFTRLRHPVGNENRYTTRDVGADINGPLNLLDAGSADNHAARLVQTMRRDATSRCTAGMRGSYYSTTSITGEMLLDPSRGNFMRFTMLAGSALRPAIQAPYDQDADSWGIDVYIDATALSNGIPLSRSNMPAGVALLYPRNLGGVLLDPGIHMFSCRKLAAGLVITYCDLAIL